MEGRKTKETGKHCSGLTHGSLDPRGKMSPSAGESTPRAGARESTWEQAGIPRPQPCSTPGSLAGSLPSLGGRLTALQTSSQAVLHGKMLILAGQALQVLQDLLPPLVRSPGSACRHIKAAWAACLQGLPCFCSCMGDLQLRGDGQLKQDGQLNLIMLRDWPPCVPVPQGLSSHGQPRTGISLSEHLGLPYQ